MNDNDITRDCDTCLHSNVSLKESPCNTCDPSCWLFDNIKNCGNCKFSGTLTKEPCLSCNNTSWEPKK